MMSFNFDSLMFYFYINFFLFPIVCGCIIKSETDYHRNSLKINMNIRYGLII